MVANPSTLSFGMPHHNRFDDADFFTGRGFERISRDADLNGSHGTWIDADLSRDADPNGLRDADLNGFTGRGWARIFQGHGFERISRNAD
jgi:hypothetical protein